MLADYGRIRHKQGIKGQEPTYKRPGTDLKKARNKTGKHKKTITYSPKKEKENDRIFHRKRAGM